MTRLFDRCQVTVSHVQELVSLINIIVINGALILSCIDQKSNSSKNTAACICRLPVELLVKIALYFVHDPSPTSTQPRRIQTLTLVSRLWHDIMETTPQVWTFLSTRFPPKYTPMAIRKSKTAGLTITQSHLFFDLTSDNPNALARQALVEIYRWHLVDLTMNSPDEDMLKALEHPASRIASFRLWIKDAVAIIWPINLFAGHAPLLRSVALIDVPIAWNLWDFQRLWSLSLISTEYMLPSTSELIRILQGCPDLETLHLEATDSSPTERHIIRIPLLKLRSLKLIYLPPAMLHSVLESIHAPRCSTLQFRCNFTQGSPGAFLPSHDALSSRFPSIDRLIREAHHAEVRDPTQLSITYTVEEKGADAMFGSTCAQCDLAHTLDWLREINPRLGETPVNLAFETARAGNHDMLSLLDRSFTVISIRVLSDWMGDEAEGDNTQLMNYLGFRRSYGSLQRWPFMHLRDFGIWSGHCAITVLVAMVRNRFAAGWAKDEQGNLRQRYSEVPASLTHMHVCSAQLFPEEIRVVVEETVGDGVVEWDE